MKRISKPGLYDVPELEYHADSVLAKRLGRSLSHSGAKTLANPKLTPAHFQHEREHGRPAKRTFDFGHAAHAFLLGTGLDIVRVDARDWRTNAAKAAAEEARERGAVPLLAEEYDRAQVMVEAARKHERVRQILDRAEAVEKSAYWVDHQTGVTRRARFDLLSRARSGRLI
ncbi:MAG TPA: PD-(D/E)XK nuclease-like domain-containing protein, partial [Phytomonospora sp.]